MKANYDNAWKLVLECFFRQCMEFLLPGVAVEIDWEKPPVFLDKELLAIQRKGAVGNKIADKLAKVQKIEGEEAWVIIHVEVQGKEEVDFSSRMFEYFYRIHDRYKVPLFSLAILTDTNKQWRPQSYFQKLWDCELLLKYPTIKLIDYINEENKLDKIANPIAQVILGHLVALRTRNKPELRFENKLRLVKKLYKLGYTAEYIRTLYNFIDYTMILPRKLEKAFITDIKKYEEEVEVRYINSAERFGMEAGRKEGKKEGKKEGIKIGKQQGIHSGQCYLLRLLLEKKFGKLESQYIAQVEEAALPEIERIVEAALHATDIKEVFSAQAVAKV